MVRGNNAVRLTFVAAFLVLVGVFAMRWNVVIGGQLISKSLRGLVDYTPAIGGREGLLAAAAIMMLPFYIFSVIVSFLPPWDRPGSGEAEGVLEPSPAPTTSAAPQPRPSGAELASRMLDREGPTGG